MIVLSHSWHAEDIDHGDYDKWASRYRWLIKYAKYNNVQIVTLPQGMQLWGNDPANEVDMAAR